MRIVLLSEYSGTLDEGMRNIAYYYHKYLNETNEVVHINIRPLIKFLSPEFWVEIRKFNPHIVHFIPGSGIKSYIFMKLFKLVYPNPKIVISGIHPTFTNFSKIFLPFFLPELLLVQSRETEKMFKRIDCKTVFLINGVDVDKFKPVSSEIKEKLKNKYGLNDKKVILHVGPIENGRNIQVFNKLQKYRSDVQVVIIGSISVDMELDIYNKLKKGGCIILREYFDNIEEIYSFSDCYIFPTFSKTNAVEFPLSVMEAMSCNTPVISTKFGALAEFFTEGDDLRFISNENEIYDIIDYYFNNRIEHNNRDKVIQYSWQSIVKELENIYKTIVGDNV